ncbi:MSMEG_0570 family nitrogen starvation response protein [Paractinoplanes atraurantiacus]|uniref:MSMEG_0570 family protein n=1 Tax=Paractinoplanes atraurantiacus TaxID=1036182 RepID=A0A285K247_9ACTN|nr:MSMEG_0570 family nitrogen starvation response protein [Actinoplanes atraurantiacus]SNY66087.1 MSMEG_0570 family protein [Actinoplanes atraurantiacus]
MPERYVLARWPDGTRQRIYSPSTVVEDYFSDDHEYAVADFVNRCRTALRIASDRVQQAYGFPCSRAAASLVQVEQHAVRHSTGAVTVEGIEA